MDVKYTSFISEYYKRTIFREMSWPQFLQFCDDVKKDNLSKNQKSWRDNFLQKDAAGNLVQTPTGEYVRKPMPDPNITNGDWHLNDTEWEKMYRAFQAAFRGLKSNESSFTSNNDATGFLNRYFGPTATSAHVFDEVKVNQAAKDQIDILKTILTNPATNDVVVNLVNEGKMDDKDEIIDGIDSKQYVKSEEFRRKLNRIAYHIQGLLSNPVDTYLGDQIRRLHLPLNLSLIYDDFEDTTIDPVCLANFKGTYASMLSDLYKKKDIRTEFEKYDTQHIVQHIDSAKSSVSYNDATNNPDDYVTPKGDDELNFKQRVAQWWDNTFEGYLEKYVKLRGDRMFFSDSAKEIARAFDKLTPPVKPTDGLAKILESCDKASEKLKLRKSKAHLKWFKDNLKEVQKTMPKAFAGALQHGHQLRAVVAEIIRRAVDNNKIEEAKTTMELLSVMKYGMTTSKTMDALKNEKLTVFSDKSLSWNKNSEAMQFVSNAVDQSLRFAMLGIGYGITMAGNAYRLSRSKFNGDRGNILRNQQTREKQAAIQNTNDLNTLARAEKTNQEALRNATNIVDDADLANKKNDSQTQQNHITNTRRLINGDNIRIGRKERQIQYIDSMIQQINDVNDEIQNIAAQIQIIDAELAKPIYNTQPVSQDNQDVAAALKQQKANYIIQRNKLDIDLRNAQSMGTLAEWQQRRNIAERYKTGYENDLQNHTNDLNTHTQTKNDLDKNISQYESAQQTIGELDRQINARDAEMQNWDANHHDQYKELMAYWDMLETGRDSRTGVMYKWMPGNRKTHQANFDAQKNAIRTNYLNAYSIVA